MMGRLTCEYVVDMYPRTEEHQLNYLKLSRAIQAFAFENTLRWLPADLVRYKIRDFYGIPSLGVGSSGGYIGSSTGVG